MTVQPNQQSGFSAVELLITLFIAAAFIITGYQLYGVVIKDSSAARQRAKASNIGYSILRKYSPQATDPCVAVTPSPAPNIPPGSDLPKSSVTVTFSCPYSSNTAITKLEVTVKYGSPVQEVNHAIYVSK